VHFDLESDTGGLWLESHSSLARKNLATIEVVGCIVHPPIHHWLAALERLVMAKGLADSASLRARKEAWANAYRRTPHGKPVEAAIGSDRET
jgi:hypothetical protein